MNETIKTIQKLSSTHGNFSEQQVSKEDIEIIIKSAVKAANASNRQSYSILVVEDKDVMKEYFQYVGSVALLFCVDYNRLTETGAHLGYNVEHGGVIDFITGTTDTAFAAQTAAIAAQSLGIDYLFTNSIHRGSLERLYEKFQLPETVSFPVIALILGYGNAPKHESRGRLEKKGIVHWNTYEKCTSEELEEIIDAYDQDRRMGLVFFNEESRKKFRRYMDWFFQVWNSSNPERKKAKELEVREQLIKIGFL